MSKTKVNWDQFNGKSTADDIARSIDLTGKLVIVTGANTGIGFEIACSMASSGARVIFACRNMIAGKQAVQKVKKLHPQANAEVSSLDLARFDSIKDFAHRYKDENIDILVCNAGVMNSEYKETSNGIEHTVGVSHFGHFLLTNLLLPQLLRGEGARVVVQSSSIHTRPAKLAFDKFPLTVDNFSMLESYSQAKLCNLLFSNELHRRYFAKGLSACAVHPGNFVTTNIDRGSRLMRIVFALTRPFTKTPSQGAATAVYCAAYPDPAGVSGKYFSDCQIDEASEEAEDPQVAMRLWKISEELCAL